MDIRVGDIVNIVNENGSWLVQEIKGQYCTCIECSDSGIGNRIITVAKNMINCKLGNTDIWK